MCAPASATWTSAWMSQVGGTDIAVPAAGGARAALPNTCRAACCRLPVPWRPSHPTAGLRIWAFLKGAL